MAQRYYRKVIKIRGEDSPNVRLGMAEKARGLEPSNRMLVPGVLSYHEYVKRRVLWDKVRQCIGLDAEFWEGADALLYPPDWLNAAEASAAATTSRLTNILMSSNPRSGGRFQVTQRVAEGIGVDPAEGGDKTSMTAVDRLGIIEQVAKPTPNTAKITGEVMAFAMKHGVGKADADKILFDRGGGGFEHADRLAEDHGWDVRSVGFGEAIVPEPTIGMVPTSEKVQHREERYGYLNRRAQMYGEVRLLLDPSTNQTVFGIPAEYTELRRQMSLIPLTYNKEGRMYVLPKNPSKPGSDEMTLTKLLGCSPDELDSLVLAVHAMLHRWVGVEVGAV